MKNILKKLALLAIPVLLWLAGPVIAFGTLASFVWGVLYWLLGKVG